MEHVIEQLVGLVVEHFGVVIVRLHLRLEELHSEGFQRVSFGGLNVVRGVGFLEGLADVLQECESQLLLHLLVRHAQHEQVLYIDVVEHIVLQLERFARFRLHLQQQLHGYLLEVARVGGVIAKHDVALLGHEHVKNCHCCYIGNFIIFS